MPLNKPQLVELNQENFPDNTQQLITPVLLREFNDAMINSMELTQSMDAYANLGTANLFYGGNQSIAKEYKLFTNGVYWNDSTVGYNNLEIINSATGNIDLAALGGGVRIVSSSLNITNGTFTASLQEGFTYVGNGSNRTTLVSTSSFGTPIPAGTISGSQQITDLGFVSSSVTASSLITASFSGNTLTFTKGDSSTFGVVIPDISGSTIDTGSFATTGSNTFIGDETFSNASGNATTLTSFSGSLVFTPKAGFASSSSLQNHLFISASATGQTSITNIIFNTLAQGSPTGSVIISGSNNIFPIPTTNTAGFQRRIGTGNLALAQNTLPQFTSSMSNVPVVYNNNLHAAGNLTFRGPISSSTYIFTGNYVGGGVNFGDATESMISASAGISFQNNHFVAAPTFRAGRTQLSASVNATQNIFGNGGHTTTLASSSITYNQNSFYGTGIGFVNAYFAPSASANNQRVEFQYNLVGGQSAQFYTSGSNTTTTFNRQISNNFIGGNFCIISASANGDNSSLLGNIIYGNNLRVNANSPYSSGVFGLGYGSAFIGRNNDINGTKANSAETIFAVGTGTSFSNRKTGFLIDSGSNTFVEGTLNVSGSTSFNGAVNITGSLTSSLTLGYVWVGGAGNVSTLVATSSFAGGSVPAGTVSSSAQITALGFVSSSVTASSLITASVNLNTITFTKGDSSTFAITVDTGSGGGSVPAGTVSSSAQILNYNIFATTSSNNFVGTQNINGNLNITNNKVLTTPYATITALSVDGGMGFSQVGNPSDTGMGIQSANKTSMYCSVVSISSGYNSGSSFVLNASTGSNPYGGSGSADFNMTAQWAGKLARMQVNSSVGTETLVNGLAERILFAGTAGSPNTPSNTFRVEANSIELEGIISSSQFSNSANQTAIRILTGSLNTNGSIIFDGLYGGTIPSSSATMALAGTTDFRTTYYINGTDSGSKISYINDTSNYKVAWEYEARSNGTVGGFALQNLSGSTALIIQAKEIECNGSIKLQKGSNKQTDTAVLDGGNPGTVTVSNSLVTSNSIILLTKQTLTNAHMVAVSSKGSGTFTITSNGNGDSDTVGYMIINATP